MNPFSESTCSRPSTSFRKSGARVSSLILPPVHEEGEEEHSATNILALESEVNPKKMRKVE